MYRTSSLALGEHVHALENAILKALVVLKQVIDAGILAKPAGIQDYIQVFQTRLNN